MKKPRPLYYEIHLTGFELDETIRVLREAIAAAAPGVLPLAERTLQNLEAVKYDIMNGDSK
jgi:hypothetical protein